MKEPAKDSENQFFQRLELSQLEDDDNFYTPLHRSSTPKNVKQDFNPLYCRRNSKLEQHLKLALAQRDDQLGTILNAYEGLVAAWQQEDNTDADKTLEEDGALNGVNWEIDSRLSGLSQQSTPLSEGYLDNCELPEQVLDLIKELAQQLLQCQKDIAAMTEENKNLKLKTNEIEIKKRESDLLAEIDAWKDSSNESRKEIESLKNSLRNYEAQIDKLKLEKGVLSEKIARLKNNNHGDLEKEEPLLAAYLAQQKHFSQNIKTLKRLNDKQQQVISHLQTSLVTKAVNNLVLKPESSSSSSGRATLQSSLNVSSESVPSIDKRISTPPRSQTIKRTTSLPTPVQYDESLVKLSRLLITSNEMLRQVEGTKMNTNTNINSQ